MLRFVRAHYPRPRLRPFRRVETPPGAQAQVDWGEFANLDIGCGWSEPAQWGVAQEPNGSAPPRILIDGGSIRGQFSGGFFQKFTGGGKLVVKNIFGYDQ